MKTAEIFFANGSNLKWRYSDIQLMGEWLQFSDAYMNVLLSVSSRQVLYIEHDVDA